MGIPQRKRPIITLKMQLRKCMFVERQYPVWNLINLVQGFPCRKFICILKFLIYLNTNTFATNKNNQFILQKMKVLAPPSQIILTLTQILTTMIYFFSLEILETSAFWPLSQLTYFRSTRLCYHTLTHGKTCKTPHCNLLSPLWISCASNFTRLFLCIWVHSSYS